MYIPALDYYAFPNEEKEKFSQNFKNAVVALYVMLMISIALRIMMVRKL